MNRSVLIWDLPLRIFHWLFGSSILLAWYFAENDQMENHVLCGYAILVLLVFRILWGFVGSKHARFSNFIPSPSKVTGYLKTFKQSKMQYAGHNPAGSVMVFLMLSIVALQAISGLFIDDDIFTSGPYYGVLSDSIEKIMSKIHHTNFDIILIAIGLHIAAIIFYQKFKRHDLVIPMISGKKVESTIPKNSEITSSKILRALICFAIALVFIYWLVEINPPVIEEDYYY